MNYPIWDQPASGLFIALISVFHVFISHFAVGGGLFLVLTERKARRENDTALLAYTRRHSRFFLLVTLVLGAITGVGIWFAIALVHPAGTSSLINTFVWGWASEWTFFIVEIAAAMVYYYGWDRLDAKTHEIVGWIYFVAAWASLLIINGIIAYQLTPGDWPRTREFWDGFLNPSYLPSTVARTFVCIGLAGIYALLTSSRSKDPLFKRRMAAWAGGCWVLPMALALPLSLIWYLASVAGAGVPVGRIFGATSDSVGAVIVSIFSGGEAGGYPNLHNGAFVSLVASAGVAIVTLLILFTRRERYGLPSTVLLLVFGQLAFAGGEWVREDLRKPYIIHGFMFVNGVRLPASETVPAPPPAAREQLRDRFSMDALAETGVLGASLWLPAPTGFDPHDGPNAILNIEARAALEVQAGERLFIQLCSCCHTLDGYVALRPLVAGSSVGAIEKMLATLARPVDASGSTVPWSYPKLRLKTRLGRRMPPFPGTPVEAHALAVYLARIGGDPQAGIVLPTTTGLGETLFEDNCAMCHGPDEDAPMAELAAGASFDELFDKLGRLPDLSNEMDAFEGSDAERKALATFLAKLGGKEVTP